MTNDTLLSVPLFVFMGYIMERAALVDRMFHSVQLAFRRVPASLAVTTLLVCAFWGIASGIVGAVVVLMGVIAMRPMLNAGYDVRLAAGAITAGGTLGILIPPSVMLIVYAAVAGQSIVKLYAAAMLPGFFLTVPLPGLHPGLGADQPPIAPKLAPDQYRVAVPDHLRRLEQARGGSVVPGSWPRRSGPGAPGYRRMLQGVLVLSVPLLLTLGVFTATWWYVVVYNAPEAAASSLAPPSTAARVAAAGGGARGRPRQGGEAAGARAAATSERAEEEKPQELGAAGDPAQEAARPEGPPEEMTSLREPTASTGRARFPPSSMPGTGGWPGCPRCSCSSTTPAWTASSSRSSASSSPRWCRSACSPWWCSR